MIRHPGLTPVTAFETGTNRWLALPTWSSGCAAGCGIDHQSAQAGGNLRLGSARGRRCRAYGPDPAARALCAAPFISAATRAKQLADLVGGRSTGRCVAAELQHPALKMPVKISGEPLPTYRLPAGRTGLRGEVDRRLRTVDAACRGYQLMVSWTFCEADIANRSAIEGHSARSNRSIFALRPPSRSPPGTSWCRAIKLVPGGRNPQSYVGNIFFKPLTTRKRPSRFSMAAPMPALSSCR